MMKFNEHNHDWTVAFNLCTFCLILHRFRFSQSGNFKKKILHYSIWFSKLPSQVQLTTALEPTVNNDSSKQEWLLVDIYRGKFPLLATGTEVNDTEIMELKKMILTHLLLQRLQYFRAQLLYISTQNPPRQIIYIPL